MAVSKRTRFEVLRRDNYVCRYCRSTDNPLTVDHVTPVALGGTDDPSNLVAACRDCNAGKASSSPDAATVADVAQDAVRWANAMKAAARKRARARKAAESYVEKFLAGWEPVLKIAPVDWRESVQAFYEAGLPVDDLIYALHKSVGNVNVADRDIWRYMCGIAWRVLAEMREEAANAVAVR